MSAAAALHRHKSGPVWPPRIGFFCTLAKLGLVTRKARRPRYGIGNDAS
jgi:hypothetical protein